ncbi:MAG: AraC family transcriptional regulator [Opitutaceae bacterium]
MHNPHIAQSGEKGTRIGEGGTGNTPPIWHKMEVAPVVFRSLRHDPSEAEEHSHDAVELILNLGMTLGAIVWRDADGVEKTEQICAEDCCFIPAGVPHVISGLNVHGVVSLLVGGVIIAEFTSRNLTRVMVENLRQLTARDSMAGGLVAEFGHSIMRQPHVLLVNALGFALALKLLHALLYRDNGYDKDHAPLCSSEQRRALDYLREHAAERVQIADLARQLGLSRAHFARRFRATFGMPPLQYVLKMRVDRGLELLRGGEYRVAEAAYAVGFYDQSHFDRHCHKFYGHSPSAMQRI